MKKLKPNEINIISGEDCECKCFFKSPKSSLAELKKFQKKARQRIKKDRKVIQQTGIAEQYIKEGKNAIK